MLIAQIAFVTMWMKTKNPTNVFHTGFPLLHRLLKVIYFTRQVLQEASEHLPGLHSRDCLHVQPVWLPRPAGLLQVDGLRCIHLKRRAQPAHPLYQYVPLQLQ